MATEFCLVTLLDSKEFGTLDINDQRQRLVQFVATWFDLDQPLDTVDHVRLTARLRAHAAKLHISAGEVMELILPLARKQHAQDVYERSATAIWDEDQQAKESIPISASVSNQVADNADRQENAEATPTGNVSESTPPKATTSQVDLRDDEPTTITPTVQRPRARSQPKVRG